MSSAFFRYQRLILPVSLWLASLMLLSVQSYRKGHARPSPFSRAVAETVSLPQRSYVFFADGVKHSWTGYVYLVRVRERNLALQKELSLAQMENQSLRAQVGETERLRSLLNFRETLGRHALPARIIGWDLSSYAQTITINKGSRDGIRAGQPVLCSQGVIGQVVDEPGRPLARDRASVLLITDPTSRVSVVVERSRDRAILQGVGRADRLLLLYLFDARLAPGDVINTSGLGGIFPPGFKAGTISKLEINAFYGSLEGWVKPSADLAHLEEVLVVTRPKENQTQGAQPQTESKDVLNKD